MSNLIFEIDDLDGWNSLGGSDEGDVFCFSAGIADEGMNYDIEFKIEEIKLIHSKLDEWIKSKEGE